MLRRGNYTWNEGFYEDETKDDKFTLRQSIKWNYREFKRVLKNDINSMPTHLIYLPLKFRYYKLRYKYRTRILPFYEKIILLIITKCLLFKLRNKNRVTLEYSPYSESRYILYDYANGYIKIRISAHGPTINDNSNIFITI